MPKIGVEESLSQVQHELQAKGYEVVTLKNEQDAKGCDCCVITGLDENIMGIQNAVTKGAVINASGRTVEEICNQVEQKLQ